MKPIDQPEEETWSVVACCCCAFGMARVALALVSSLWRGRKKKKARVDTLLPTTRPHLSPMIDETTKLDNTVSTEAQFIPEVHRCLEDYDLSDYTSSTSLEIQLKSLKIQYHKIILYLYEGDIFSIPATMDSFKREGDELFLVGNNDPSKALIDVFGKYEPASNEVNQRPITRLATTQAELRWSSIIKLFRLLSTHPQSKFHIRENLRRRWHFKKSGWNKLYFFHHPNEPAPMRNLMAYFSMKHALSPLCV
jgi:hypothetical protein